MEDGRLSHHTPLLHPAAEVARQRDREAELRRWLERVNDAVGATLRAAGWHRHHREWRRKRGATVEPLATWEQVRGTWMPAELSARAGELDPAVREKARAGNRSALPAVEEYLANPAAAALWGDFGRHVLVEWVRLFAGKDLLRERGLLRFASDLRSRLAGPDPNPLDLLLAERVVIAWVFASWAQWQYAATLMDLSIKHNEFHLKRIDLANRGLLAACRTLAKVKRTALPDVLALVNVNAPPGGGSRPG